MASINNDQKNVLFDFVWIGGFKNKTANLIRWFAFFILSAFFETRV